MSKESSVQESNVFFGQESNVQESKVLESYVLAPNNKLAGTRHKIDTFWMSSSVLNWILLRHASYGQKMIFLLLTSG